MDSKHSLIYLASGIIVIIIAVGGFTLYKGNSQNTSLSTQQSPIATSTGNSIVENKPIPALPAASSTSTSDVAWNIISSSTLPIAVKTSTSHGDTYKYDFYNIGTFVRGPLSGDTLEVILNPAGAGYYQIAYLVTTATGTPIGIWKIKGMTFPQELGLDTIPTLPDSEIPQELLYPNQVSSYVQKKVPEGILEIDLQGTITFPPTIGVQPFAPFGDFQGDPIVRTLYNTDSSDLFSGASHQYYVQLPIGMVMSVSLTPDFFLGAVAGTPRLTWTTGSSTVYEVYDMSQSLGSFEYDFNSCFAGFSKFTSIQAALVRTGTTVYNAPVYEVNPDGHNDVYQCLYELYKTSVRGYGTQGPIPYPDFVKAHPVFFWESGFGDWFFFDRDDFYQTYG